MGNVASSVRDAGLQRMVFNAPPCGYSDAQCEAVYTDSGAKVAMRLFTPQNDMTVVDSTRQRWLARMDYIDTRLLCLFSHGNSDDLESSAAYSQWMSNTFNMNVVYIVIIAVLAAAVLVCCARGRGECLLCSRLTARHGRSATTTPATAARSPACAQKRACARRWRPCTMSL